MCQIPDYIDGRYGRDEMTLVCAAEMRSLRYRSILDHSGMYGCDEIAAEQTPRRIDSGAAEMRSLRREATCVRYSG